MINHWIQKKPRLRHAVAFWQPSATIYLGGNSLLTSQRQRLSSGKWPASEFAFCEQLPEGIHI